jgi:hypothetical protein
LCNPYSEIERLACSNPALMAIDRESCPSPGVEHQADTGMGSSLGPLVRNWMGRAFLLNVDSICLREQLFRRTDR